MQHGTKLSLVPRPSISKNPGNQTVGHLSCPSTWAWRWAQERWSSWSWTLPFSCAIRPHLPRWIEAEKHKAIIILDLKCGFFPWSLWDWQVSNNFQPFSIEYRRISTIPWWSCANSAVIKRFLCVMILPAGWYLSSSNFCRDDWVINCHWQLNCELKVTDAWRVIREFKWNLQLGNWIQGPSCKSLVTIKCPPSLDAQLTLWPGDSKESTTWTVASCQLSTMYAPRTAALCFAVAELVQRNVGLISVSEPCFVRRKFVQHWK